MDNINRLIAACAMLVAALTLLVPLSEIEPDDCYGDKSLADNSPVLGEEETKNTIDWNNRPIKLSYSFDGTNWTEIPLKYEESSWSPSYVLGGNAIDLSGVDDDNVIHMKAEPTADYSKVSADSTILIENLEVSWQHTSSEGVTLHYAAFIESQDNGWSWQVPVSTLGKCDYYDYPSIDFVVNGTECLCKLFESVNGQRISLLSLDSPRSMQSDLDALVGTYVCDNQTIQIYKNGDVYVKRIVGEVINGQPAVNEVKDVYYIFDENGIKETSVPVGFSNNVYLIINKNLDDVISLKALNKYTYSSANPEFGTILEGSIFERKSTGISINGFEYPDIQTAINCANGGDIVKLNVGEYHLDEFITIDKNITLEGVIGDSKETSSVITGFQGSAEDKPVNIRIVDTAATLDSLWIDGGSGNIKFNGDNSKGITGAIDLQTSNDAIVQNCRFIKPEESNQSVAIYAGKGSHIYNNYFEGWQKAVYSEVKSSAGSISLVDNTFFNKSDINGLYFVNITSSNAILNGNTFTNGKISNSSEVLTITKNVFENAILNVYRPSEIFENVFISNTVVENKITNEILDVSANYWGGDKPNLDASKFKFDSWFTTYDDSTKTLGRLTFEDNITHIFVDCNNESEGDGTKDNPYQTISEALANVKYGQEIYVVAGTYAEEIVITSGLRNITLIGSNYANDANGKSWDQNGTILTNGISIETRGTHEDPYPNIVDGLTIKGFEFQKKGFVVVGWWENGSISNITIENNRFIDIDDGSNAAIHFNTSVPMAVNNILIKCNFIENVGSDKTSPSGINISSAKGTVIIEENHILNTNHGSIQVSNQSSGELIIQNNHLENWDSDAFKGGRAFRFDHISIDKITIYLNSLVQKSDFKGDDLKDMYLKITNSETFIEASGNYWDGMNPTVEGFPIFADDNCIVIIHSWYTQYDPETNELSGLENDDTPGVLPDVPPDVPSVPSFPDVPTVPEVPTPDENGDVSIEIPKKDIDKIVDDAVSSGSGSVIITDVSDIENASSVTISKENLQNILDKIDAEDAISDAVVKLPEGAVTIGKDVLSSILETAEEKSITIKVSDAKDALNEEQQKIVGDRPVYDITMLRGSEKVTSFNGKTITVSLPYELKENESPDNIVVYYVKDDGTIEKMDCIYKDGNVSFETNHLSYFAISYEEPEPIPEEPAADDNDNTIYYAIAAVVILIVIAAAAYFIIKRKQ